MTQRKETKLVDFDVLEGNLTLSKGPSVKNDEQNKKIAYSGELQLMASVGSSRDQFQLTTRTRRAMKVQENDIKKEMKGENNGNATNYQVR